MGGTDRMDENLSLYRIGIRGKKWWWSIFTWLIDVTIHNSWLTYKKAGHDMRQLQFRREIAQTYLERYKKPPKTGGRPVTSPCSSTGSRLVKVHGCSI